MVGFTVFIGKYEVFFSIIDCWKIRGVLSALVVGWKKEQLFRTTFPVAALVPSLYRQDHVHRRLCAVIFLKG